MAEAKAFTKEQLAEMAELHFGHSTCLEATWLATVKELNARIAEAVRILKDVVGNERLFDGERILARRVLQELETQ